MAQSDEVREYHKAQAREVQVDDLMETVLDKVVRYAETHPAAEVSDVYMGAARWLGGEDGLRDENRAELLGLCNGSHRTQRKYISNDVWERVIGRLVIAACTLRRPVELRVVG